MAIPHDLLEAIIVLTEAADAEDVKTALKTLVTVVGNAQNPEKRALKTSNAGLQKRILGLKAGEEALIASGFLHSAEGTLEWDASHDAAQRAAALGQVAQLFEGVVATTVTVGDANAPGVAQEALKLCGTYVGNIATDPENASLRRIGAANKALNARLLGANGGAALLAACGFVPEPPQGEAEAFVNTLEIPLVRVALVALGKASQVWAALAASRNGGGVDAETADGSGPRAPKLTSDTVSTAVEAIVLRSLPGRAQLLMTCGAADMQPALCRTDDGRHVQLHTWQEAARAWTLQGSMAVPSTEFVWERPNALLVLVDLGDAHGTGQPVELRAAVLADSSALENDYVSARDFIEGHIAESYAKGQDPVLNQNYLEEIARKLRVAAGPVLTTIANLKAAMEAQN